MASATSRPERRSSSSFRFSTSPRRPASARAADDQVSPQAGPPLTTILAIVAAYLLGAIPTSYIAGKLGRGIDLREHGSKNLGATNVYRILGWKYAIPVALFDIAKGAISVLLFPSLLGGGETWLPVVLGGGAVLGHMYSPYVTFRGGEGGGSGAGRFHALAPGAGLLREVARRVSPWRTG